MLKFVSNLKEMNNFSYILPKSLLNMSKLVYKLFLFPKVSYLQIARTSIVSSLTKALCDYYFITQFTLVTAFFKHDELIVLKLW